MRRTLTLVAWLAFALTSSAATYYIDATGGSDLNNGLATVTPWQHHPFMANWGGTYVHVAGDTFIFKGGETWGHASFPWHITDGGSGITPDYYITIDTWFTGATFSAPVFDAGGTELPGGYDVMVLFDPTTRPHHITMIGLDFRGLYWSGNKAYGWVAYMNLQTSYNITVRYCRFLDWTHAPMPTSDQLKIVIGANSAPWNPNCSFETCTFDGVNSANATQGMSSGEASYAFSGNFSNCTVRNIASGFIVTGDPASVTPQVVSGCEIGPTYMSYDSGAHPDGLFMNGGNLFYWHDNLIHDNWVESIFAGNGSGAEKLYLWNNVIWNCKTSPAIIENNFYAGAELYVWNNTIASGPLYCIRNVNRGVGPLGVLDMRNNLFITDAGVLLQDPGASITTLIDQNNVTLSTGSAFVQGYSEANLYQPTSAGAPTVDVGQDLSGELLGALTLDRLGVTRPQGSAWDAGAYEFFIAASPGTVAFSTDFQQTCETCGQVGITLIRSGGVLGDVTVTVSSFGVTATPGVDYVETTNTLAWANGETGARSFLIPILNSGDTGNTNRDFIVGVVGSTGGVAIGDPFEETVSIALTQPPQVDFGSVTFSPVSYSTVPTAGTVTLSVLRSGSTNVALALNYATANGTATAGTDYTATSGNLSWATNDNSAKTFTVPIIASGATGAPRTFTVTLSGFTPTGVAVGTATATVTIVLPPQPVPGTLALSSAATSVAENGGAVTITVVRANGTNGIVSVTVTTSNQTATAGHDYTAVSTTLTWADNVFGPQSFTVPILASGDTATTNRTFLVTLSAPTGGATLVSPTQETVTILMNPPIIVTNAGTLTFTAANYATTSTNANVTLTVLRTGSTNMAASINYVTANGTALAGVDYIGTGGTLTWATNANTAQTITVPLINSGAFGTNRMFTVSLSGASSGVTLGISNATVTINLPPPVAGTIALSSSAVSVSQNAANVTITAFRAGGTNGAVSVTASTSDQTAIAGHDYTATSTTLNWADTVFGNVSFTVPILASGDTAATNRTFFVTLSAPAGGAALASPFQETVTIIMNPPQPTNGGTFAFSAPNYSTTLTSGSVTITVTRSGATNESASVNYTTMNGTALAGTDYTATGGTLSWTANDNAAKTFTVPILNSGATGPQRLFTVALSNPTGTAKLGLAMATVSIQLAPRPGVLGLIVLNGPVNVRGGRITMRGSP